MMRICMLHDLLLLLTVTDYCCYCCYCCYCLDLLLRISGCMKKSVLDLVRVDCLLWQYVLHLAVVEQIYVRLMSCRHEE